MSKHRQEQEDIYSSACVQALELKYCSSCSAAVVSSCLVSSHGLGARLVSCVYHGGRRVVYTVTAAAMLVQNMAPAVKAADIYVSSGVTSSNLVMSDGYIYVLSSGTTISTTLNQNGYEYISEGGVASGTTINNGGAQYIDLNGVANNTIVNSGGWQNVRGRGVASDTTIEADGVLDVGIGGSAVNVIQNSGGKIDMPAIISGDSTYISGTNQNGETMLLESGVASNFIVNSDSLSVHEGGIASNTIVNSGNIGVTSAMTFGTIMNGSGIESINAGGVTVSTVLQNEAHQDVWSGGIASNTVVTSDAGYQGVFGGGIADGTILNGGPQFINAGGVATNTTVNSGGEQYVHPGASANNTTLNSGGVQHVQEGASADNITINEGGEQYVENGGTVTSTTVNSGGRQEVLSGAVANDTTVSSGGVQRIADGAVASNTVVNSGGVVRLDSKASLLNLVQLDGANINVSVFSGGSTLVTGTNQNGAEMSLSSGVASNFIVNAGGTHTVISGGSSFNVIQSEGGNINVEVVGGSTTYVSGINQNGEEMSLSNGVASNFIINSGGGQRVYSGGVANNTIVTSGGGQEVREGGVASNTLVYSGGLQYAQNGGVLWNTSVFAGGTQGALTGGVMSNTVIYDGGSAGALLGGIAENVTVSSGGMLFLSAGGIGSSTTVLNGGVEYVFDTCQANDTTVDGGGVQQLFSGAVANGTTINSGGSQLIALGAIVSNTTVNNGGVQGVDDGIVVNNTTVNQGGVQDVLSGGVANNTTLAGGALHLNSGGVANNTTLAGGVLHLNSGGVADALNAQGGVVRLYGDGQLTGAVVLSGAMVDFTPSEVNNHNLHVENLTANNAVFNMRVDLENQTGDQLTIDSAYNGNAQLVVTNIAPTAQETAGDGIELVEFTDPANANGTFALAGGTMTEGAYTYGLAQGTKAGEGKSYYLRSIGYAPIFKTMLNVPVMNVMVAQTGMNSLQRRLGDLQNMDNTEKKHGVWVRSYYRDVTVNDLTKTDMRLFGAEAGYDWLFRADEPTKLYAGVLIGYVNMNSLETRRESGVYEKGEGESPTVGVYATLVNDERWFVDIAARNFWTKLDMDSHNGGTVATYSPKRNVVAISAEAGTSFIKPVAQNKFIRIEPKAEVGWMNAAKGDTAVHNGVGDLHYDEANYLNAKGGILLSYNTTYGDGLLIEPLVELAYRYEFDGKGNISYGGATEESNLKGGSLEVNAGLNMQLTKDLYWYALGSYENGPKIEGWGVYAGIRYKFGGGKKAEEQTMVQPEPIRQEMVLPEVEEIKEEVAPEIAAEPVALKERTHVLFSFNSYVLSARAKEEIDAFAQAYKANHQTRKILVEGYACDIGTEKGNQLISLGRADMVREELIAQGIDAEKIEMKSYGRSLFAKMGFGRRKDYRRVEISLMK